MKLKERIKQLIQELNHDVFEKEEIQSFWMKNTLLTLDIVFMDSDGKVNSIYENTTPNIGLNILQCHIWTKADNGKIKRNSQGDFI